MYCTAACPFLWPGRLDVADLFSLSSFDADLRLRLGRKAKVIDLELASTRNKLLDPLGYCMKYS
jgi:hypothetical protein